MSGSGHLQDERTDGWAKGEVSEPRPAARPARSIWLALAVIAIAATGGYAVTCAIYPAPILVRSISVPVLRGLAGDTAIARLTKLGLRGRIADSVSDPQVPAGSITWQSPPAETVLPEGAVVRVGLSTGAPAVAVPDVIDLDLDLARQVLEAAGLMTGATDTVQNDADSGTVLSTQPAGGATLPAGGLVNLRVSRGPGPLAVPNLVGLALTAARERLAAMGLRVGTLEMQPQGKEGTVLEQRPAAGEFISRESAVDLIISGSQP